MPKKIRYHTIRGKRYKIELVAPSKIQYDLGVCQDPRQKGKSIKINNTLTGLEELDTWIHEFLHASFFDLSEEPVLEISTDLARLLWRLGYRKQDGNL
jgi:hypothetical protein